MVTLRAQPPAYVSRATLAAELDIAESTIDDLVRRGVLPRPIRLSSGCVRWCWETVRMSLASLAPAVNDAAPVDPYIRGAQDAGKAQEGRRGSA